jgi:hypothetical protein
LLRRKGSERLGSCLFVCAYLLLPFLPPYSKLKGSIFRVPISKVLIFKRRLFFSYSQNNTFAVKPIFYIHADLELSLLA